MHIFHYSTNRDSLIIYRNPCIVILHVSWIIQTNYIMIYIYIHCTKLYILDCKISLAKNDQKQNKTISPIVVRYKYCIKIVKHDHVNTPFTLFRISQETESCSDTCERECTRATRTQRGVCPLCLDEGRSNFNFDAFCQINVDRVTGCHSCRSLIRDMNHPRIKVDPRASYQRELTPRCRVDN